MWAGNTSHVLGVSPDPPSQEFRGLLRLQTSTAPQTSDHVRIELLLTPQNLLVNTTLILPPSPPGPGQSFIGLKLLCAQLSPL